MKTILLLLPVLGLFFSCFPKTEMSRAHGYTDGGDVTDKVDFTQSFDYEDDEAVLLFSEESSPIVTNLVSLEEEMVKLFNPDEFDCGCDERLKRKIKANKGSDEMEGFIPKVIRNKIPNTPVILMNERGANLLVHSFKVQKSDGSYTKLIFAGTAPTVNNFNQLDYLEMREGVHDNFSYSLDCTGYLTGVIRAGIGAGNNAIKSSANAASGSEKSLIVIKGIIYSPLYMAFSNEGLCKDNDSLRLEILESILAKLPFSASDTNMIQLNASYKVVVASNTGNSSFNGEAQLNASADANFIIGNAASQLAARGKIGRVSSYSSYKTYIIEKNIGVADENVSFPIKLIRDEITKIKNKQ